MRTLFALFVLANVAFFYWHTQWRPVQPVSTELPPAPIPAGVARLELLSEAPRSSTAGAAGNSTPASTAIASGKPLTPGSLAEPELDQGALQRVEPPAPAEPVAPVAAAPRACYALGPFEDKAKADGVMGEFQQVGFNVTQREAVNRTPRGYWIYLAPRPTYAAANEITKALQAKGIRDLFIMGKGEHENAISLGLYRSESAARDRFNQVKALGYTPQFEQQFRETPAYWLELILGSAEQPLVDQLAELAAQYADVTLSQKPCE